MQDGSYRIAPTTSATDQVTDMTYKYAARENNGQISSSVDAIKPETVTYGYDALKRRASAGAAVSGRRHPLQFRPDTWFTLFSRSDGAVD
jgi:hypothetical protein